MAAISTLRIFMSTAWYLKTHCRLNDEDRHHDPFNITRGDSGA